MSIDETFEMWKNKYVREDEDLDFDLIILEDMKEAWDASLEHHFLHRFGKPPSSYIF